MSKNPFMHGIDLSGMSNMELAMFLTGSASALQEIGGMIGDKSIVDIGKGIEAAGWEMLRRTDPEEYAKVDVWRGKKGGKA